MLSNFCYDIKNVRFLFAIFMRKALVILSMLGTNLAPSYLFCSLDEISGLKVPRATHEMTKRERQTIIDEIVHNMDGGHKDSTIFVLDKIPSEHLRKFADTVERVTHGMIRKNLKCYVIEELSKASLGHLEAIAETIEQLPKNTDDQLINTVKGVVKVLPSHLTVEFVETLKRLLLDTQHTIAEIIEATGKISPEYLLVFENAVHHFCENTQQIEDFYHSHSDRGLSKEYIKASFIKALSKVPPAHLTEDFEIVVDHFSQNMMELGSREKIILTFGQIPAELLPRFGIIVDRLTHDFTGEHYISKRIENFAKALDLNTLIEKLPDDITLTLRNHVPALDRENLMTSLGEVEPGEYHGIIRRMIQNYYREPEPDNNIPEGDAFEVHRYANTQVPSSGRTSSATVRLDTAVMNKIGEILSTYHIPPMEYFEAQALLNEWIERKYTDPDEQRLAKQAALHKIESDLDYEENIALAVTFMNSLHRDRIDLWLDGFVRESMEAYQQSSNSISCNKGIKERIATGMRRVDAQLDAILAQAEGPALADKFINGLHLNKAGRCREIAKELMKLGLTSGSNATQAGEIFATFMENSLAEYRVSLSGYRDTIRNMKIFVQEEGGFESFIRPALKALEIEKVKKEQDEEYQETVRIDRERNEQKRPARASAIMPDNNIVTSESKSAALDPQPEEKSPTVGAEERRDLRLKAADERRAAALAKVVERDDDKKAS